MSSVGSRWERPFRCGEIFSVLFLKFIRSQNFRIFRRQVACLSPCRRKAPYTVQTALIRDLTRTPAKPYIPRCGGCSCQNALAGEIQRKPLTTALKPLHPILQFLIGKRKRRVQKGLAFSHLVSREALSLVIFRGAV